MRKQLIVGLLSAGLVAAMLPGVTVAKGDAKWSECKKGGWSDWVRVDGSTFTDQAECVAYVAEGGTLTSPSAGGLYQSTCVGLGGQYEAPYDVYFGETLRPYPEGCYWSGIDYATWSSNYSVLGPICSTGVWEGGYVNWDPVWTACAYD